MQDCAQQKTQEKHITQMRARIAVAHHGKCINEILLIAGTADPTYNIKMWNDECDVAMAKQGHTNVNFLDCTCCENKDITG